MCTQGSGGTQSGALSAFSTLHRYRTTFSTPHHYSITECMQVIGGSPETSLVGPQLWAWCGTAFEACLQPDCSEGDGEQSSCEKVDKASLPQQTDEKTNVKLKEMEKEGSRVQGGDLEKNDNVNDHGNGVDENGEPDECLARDSEKRAAGRIAEGTELILAGSLGFMPVDEEAKVVEEQISYDKKTLENLRLKDLWLDPGRLTKDTVGLIKDQYWELSKMRVHQELRPDSIMHYYFNVYDPAPKAYLDMLYLKLKQTLYMKYRLGVLPLRGYLVRTRRLVVGLEFSDCTPGEVDKVAHFILACKKFDEARRR
ncbi:hypothetical protein NDU88_004045 [Pleurodeles waltl]|uniref:Uncharacterized protein n=1 Tax=Pleurodeles waltl TaxID=8319 RepID=A0AAV7PDZ8_PLEWA|nr:hypothetical protein NDU88_004045 [Pleurodeles waltl]